MKTTVYDIYIKYKDILENELESRELCAFAFDLDRKNILNWRNLYINDEKIELIDKLMKQRLEGKPLAYILGEWEFFSLTFKVNENVLIPRADTEILVEKALEFVENTKKDAKILDLCCGSGCIGIALLKNAYQVEVLACDISKKALEISMFNAKLNEVENRYKTLEFDVFSVENIPQKFDLIVSNPPYIKKEEIKTLDIDVRDFEPELALDGGEDGYDFYRQIIKNFTNNLNDNGKIIFEYGIGQEEEIRQIFEKYKYKDIKIYKDYNNINRIIEATKYS